MHNFFICDIKYSTNSLLFVTIELILFIIIFYISTGTIEFEDTPTSELLDSLREFSDLFSIPNLKQFCDNIDNDEEELNLSISTHLFDVTGECIKEIFFNKQLYADVKFVFDSKYITFAVVYWLVCC